MSPQAMSLEAFRKKYLQDKCQSILDGLLRQEDNKYCVDCDAKGPRWASWNLGVFLCIRCASIHRKLGVHISKVKSVSLDAWTPQQVSHLQQMGNSLGRFAYEARLPKNFRRPQVDSTLEAFIRAKYEHRKYVAEGWQPPHPPPLGHLEEELLLKNKKNVQSSSSVTYGAKPRPTPSPFFCIDEEGGQQVKKKFESSDIPILPPPPSASRKVTSPTKQVHGLNGFSPLRVPDEDRCSPSFASLRSCNFNGFQALKMYGSQTPQVHNRTQQVIGPQTSQAQQVHGYQTHQLLGPQTQPMYGSQDHQLHGPQTQQVYGSQTQQVYGHDANSQCRSFDNSTESYGLKDTHRFRGLADSPKGLRRDGKSPLSGLYGTSRVSRTNDTESQTIISHDVLSKSPPLIYETQNVHTPSLRRIPECFDLLHLEQMSLKYPPTNAENNASKMLEVKRLQNPHLDDGRSSLQDMSLAAGELMHPSPSKSSTDNPDCKGMSAEEVEFFNQKTPASSSGMLSKESILSLYNSQYESKVPAAYSDANPFESSSFSGYDVGVVQQRLASLKASSSCSNIRNNPATLPRANDSTGFLWYHAAAQSSEPFQNPRDE